MTLARRHSSARLARRKRERASAPAPAVHVVESAAESTAIEVLEENRPSALARALEPTAERARVLADKSRAAATRRAYKTQWRQFRAWCAEHELPALPAAPVTLALYLSAQSGRVGVASLTQALAAVAYYHQRAGEPSPCHAREVEAVWGGIKREKGVAPKRRARPLTPAELRTMVLGLKPGLWAVRDRALLCAGLGGAFRRSELVALDVEDVDFVDGGAAVLVRHSKTDQEARGEVVGLPFGDDRVTCPVRSLRDWIEVSGARTGAIFVSSSGQRLDGRDVARIVKRAAKSVDLSDERLSGHSLRAGLATAAAKKGKSLHAIAKQGRWKSMATVSIYIREAELFEDNAASGIGL